MKSKYIIIANWKMNPNTLEEAKRIFSTTIRSIKGVRGLSLTICPPFPYIGFFSTKIKGFTLGAQDVFLDETGASTGSVGTAMLNGLGVETVIVGHSERRLRGDTNEIVAKKVLAVLRSERSVILCVGEILRDESGDYLKFLREEIYASLKLIRKADLSRIMIAYEPVWAIGKSEKEALNPSGIHEMVLYIQKVLSDIYGRDSASIVPILYGGAVGPDNTKAILAESGVKGLLVGHISLDPVRLPLLIKSIS